MNPKRIKPYVEAENIRYEKIDRYLWMLGAYVSRATFSSTDKVLNGSKASVEYFEEPFSVTARREEEEKLQEEEKKKKVEAFFTALNVWGINHRLAQQEKEASLRNA